MTDKKTCQLIFSKTENAENVLDVGCGEGYLCNCLALKLQKPVIGLDISSRGFGRAHAICKKFKTCGLVECVKGKAEEMGRIFKEKKFDVIIFVHSFHHLVNTWRGVEESRKVLRRNGEVIIAEYSPERGKKEDNCKRFTIKFIIGSLIKNNFTNINIEQPERGFFLLVAS